MVGKNVMKELQQVPSKTTHLIPADFTTSANTTGEDSLIAEFQADVPLAFQRGRPVELRIVAYESFTTDATGGNQETFNLSNDLVDNDHVANDLIVYEGNTLQAADSINYAANSFDYTDDGTANTLHVYYLVGDQAPVTVKKVSPKNIPEDLISADAGLANMRDQYKDPLEFDPRYDLHGVVPTDWKVQVYVNADFAVQWADENDTDAEATNMALQLPIKKAARGIEGLDQAVKNAITDR